MLGCLTFVVGLWLIPGALARPMYAIDAGNYESDFLHNLTRQLAARNRVESMAIYGINRELQRTKFILAKSLEQSLMEEFQLPMVVWGHRRNVTLRRILGERTLVCVGIRSLSPHDEDIFDAVTDGLFGMHHVPILFIYKRLENTPLTLDQLRLFFAWCWRLRFINVFLAYQHFMFNNSSGRMKVTWNNYLFTYTPFPELTVKNLTETGYRHTNIMMDFRGFEFRVPVFQDVPNVFLLPTGMLSGTFGLMFAYYVAHRRGRIRLEPIADVDRYNYHEHLMLAATRGEIEIGVHPYSSLQPGARQIAPYFPLATTNTCVMVPFQQESPPGRFIRYVVRINGCFLLLLLLAMSLAWQLWGKNGAGWHRGIQLALSAFHLQSLPGRAFRRFTEPYKCIHVAVLLGSFVLWTMRTANLSSVFTSQTRGSQIETVEDFLATPLRLMLTDSEVEMYFTAGELPSALLPRLLVVNRSTLVEHLEQLNTSYAYCTTTEHWSVVLMQQERLDRPRFRLASRICTGTHILRFPMQWNSPFQRNFFRFSTQARQFGLREQWLHRGHRDAIVAGLVRPLTDDRLSARKLTLKDFQLLLNIYIMSLLASGLCLLVEIAWGCRNAKATK